MIEQNTVLKKEIGVTERKLHARNDRIGHLEVLVNSAEAKLSQRDARYEEQIRHLRHQLEKGTSVSRLMRSTGEKESRS